MDAVAQTDVDSNLRMRKEGVVKVEPNQGGSGRYECGECQKSFTTDGNRNHHVRNLHGGLRHSCSGCDKLFTQKCHDFYRFRNE